MCPISGNRIYIATFFCRVCFIFDADRLSCFFSVSNEGEHSMWKKTLDFGLFLDPSRSRGKSGDSGLEGTPQVILSTVQGSEEGLDQEVGAPAECRG